MRQIAFALAALSALSALAISAHTPARAEQTAMTSKGSIANDLNYLLYEPEDYGTSGKTYPLVVWLHGGDQGGSDIEKVRSSGLPKRIDAGEAFPFLVFSPQNPSEELLYPIEKVKAALDEVIANHRVDRSRIYVLGYSRGGFGAWAMAEQYPETFAAVVPIAGGGNRHYLNRTNEQAAFWVFHGSEDDVIPLSDSVVLYERLKALKRDARLSVLEGVSHEAVEAEALNDKAMWDWLLQQKLPSEPTSATP